jgi:uncharacterized protein YlxW (UPF0749 family)
MRSLLQLYFLFSSSVRAFRHTATFLSMQIATQMCKFLVSLLHETHTIHKNRQTKQAQQKKPSQKKAEEQLTRLQNRIHVIEKRIQELFTG